MGDFPLGKNIVFGKILLLWIYSILCSNVTFGNIVLFNMLVGAMILNGLLSLSIANIMLHM